MAQITTIALAARDVKQYVGAFTNVSAIFNPTALAAAVTNGDRIKLFSLPANAKIVGAQIRLTGTSAITGIVNLRVLEPTSNSIELTATTSTPSVAFAAVMNNPHSPITSTTGTRDIELVVQTGTFSNTTASAQLIVDVQYAFYP